jgi:TetR/AcrR family transcriptional regulator
VEVLDARARILSVATALFAARGFGATSVREVVDAAGVTKPTLYYYFANKDALFLEAVQAQIGRIRALMDGTLRGDGPPIGRLRSFVRHYVDDGLADRDGVLLLITCQHPTSLPQPQVDLLSVHADTLMAVADTLAEGQRTDEVRAGLDPTLAAVSLVGACHLLVVGGLHGMPVEPDAADRLLDLFLQGAATSCQPG